MVNVSGETVVSSWGQFHLITSQFMLSLFRIAPLTLTDMADATPHSKRRRLSWRLIKFRAEET